MAAGQPPYTGKMGSVFNQHLVGDLPHFQSPNPMPPQFVDWIKAMMAVNPDHRFRRAADAAWALSQIRMSEIADDATTIFEHRPPRESDSEYASILDLDTLVLKLDETAHLQLDEQTLVLSEDVSAPDEVEPAEDGPAPMTKLMPPLLRRGRSAGEHASTCTVRVSPCLGFGRPAWSDESRSVTSSGRPSRA